MLRCTGLERSSLGRSLAAGGEVEFCWSCCCLRGVWEDSGEGRGSSTSPMATSTSEGSNSGKEASLACSRNRYVLKRFSWKHNKHCSVVLLETLFQDFYGWIFHFCKLHRKQHWDWTGNWFRIISRLSFYFCYVFSTDDIDFKSYFFTTQKYFK